MVTELLTLKSGYMFSGHPQNQVVVNGTKLLILLEVRKTQFGIVSGGRVGEGTLQVVRITFMDTSGTEYHTPPANF